MLQEMTEWLKLSRKKKKPHKQPHPNLIVNVIGLSDATYFYS